MNPSELAREVGVPSTTVHRLVTGKSTRPYRNSLIPIADYFSMSVEQLLGEEQLPNNPRLNPSSGKNIENQIVKIPIIQWSDVNSREEIVKENCQNILSSGTISHESFGLIMPDYSMEPLFPKGSILIFDPYILASDRSFVLVKLGKSDVLTFRQILIDVEHKYLKPLNPDLTTYQMRLLAPDDQIIATLFESRVSHQPSQLSFGQYSEV